MQRRHFIASAAALAATGCIHGPEYDADEVRAGAERRDYTSLIEGEIEEGAYLHYEHGYVQQVTGVPGENELVIYTKYDEQDDDWTEDVFALWNRERDVEQIENTEIEFWAVYEGVHTHQTGDGGRDVPLVTLVDFETRD